MYVVRFGKLYTETIYPENNTGDLVKVYKRVLWESKWNPFNSIRIGWTPICKRKIISKTEYNSRERN